MQPYQRADEETRRQGEVPLKLAKTAISTGASLAGGAVLGRVMPFLSQHIPSDLAIKGLSKIDPRFGNFINTALQNGKTFDEVKDFIKEKAESSQEKKPDQKSIIEQYSPELNQFITEHMQKGRSPLEAGALAEMGGKFKDVIKKMVKDHKAPFSSILESVFGSAQQTQQNQQQNTQSQSPIQKTQSGQGQQALMDILQKIQKSRGA